MHAGWALTPPSAARPACFACPATCGAPPRLLAPHCVPLPCPASPDFSDRATGTWASVPPVSSGALVVTARRANRQGLGARGLPALAARPLVACAPVRSRGAVNAPNSTPAHSAPRLCRREPRHERHRRAATQPGHLQEVRAAGRCRRCRYRPALRLAGCLPAFLCAVHEGFAAPRCSIEGT